MKLTKKKRTQIAAAAIRDTHHILLSLKQYQEMVKSFKPEIVNLIGYDAAKSIQDAIANSSHLHGKMMQLYQSDAVRNQVAPYLADINGLNHLEEMAMELIEAMQAIQNKYKPTDATQTETDRS